MAVEVDDMLREDVLALNRYLCLSSGIPLTYKNTTKKARKIEAKRSLKYDNGDDKKSSPYLTNLIPTDPAKALYLFTKKMQLYNYK